MVEYRVGFIESIIMKVVHVTSLKLNLLSLMSEIKMFVFIFELILILILVQCDLCYVGFKVESTAFGIWNCITLCYLVLKHEVLYTSCWYYIILVNEWTLIACGIMHV